MFQPGLSELIVGKNATTTYTGLTLRNTISLGSTKWQIVGIFDAGGSAFDSEMWGDIHLISGAFKLPDLCEAQKVGHDRLATTVLVSTVGMKAVAAAAGLDID